MLDIDQNLFFQILTFIRNNNTVLTQPGSATSTQTSEMTEDLLVWLHQRIKTLYQKSLSEILLDKEIHSTDEFTWQQRQSIWELQDAKKLQQLRYPFIFISRYLSLLAPEERPTHYPELGNIRSTQRRIFQ